MSKEENDNTEQNDNKCRNCGSIEEEEGNTHIHCARCGIQKESLPDDNGFVPTNPNKTPDLSRRLGSTVGSRKDRKIRNYKKIKRLRTENVRASHNRQTFLDGVLLELSRTPTPTYLRIAAMDIIKTADSEQALSSMRHSLRGIPDPTEEAKQYRQRLFAVATLEILEDAGYEAPIAILRREWNIDRYDLMKVKSRLKKLAKGKVACLSNSATVSANTRRGMMLHQLSTFRDHLAEQESIATAREVFETAKEIASSMGEPIGDDDDWFHSETTNRPASAVAARSFMEAMHRLGFSRDSILELHGRYPVATLDTYILKKGWEGRTDDVTEEA